MNILLSSLHLIYKEYILDRDLSILEIYDILCFKMNSFELNNIIKTVYENDSDYKNTDKLIEIIIKHEIIIKDLDFLKDVVTKDNVDKWVSIVSDLDYYELLDFGIESIDELYKPDLSLYKLVDINNLLNNNITYNDICAMILYSINVSNKYNVTLLQNIDTVYEIKKDNIIKDVDYDKLFISIKKDF